MLLVNYKKKKMNANLARFNHYTSVSIQCHYNLYRLYNEYMLSSTIDYNVVITYTFNERRSYI